jgi:hypothetical protein
MISYFRLVPNILFFLLGDFPSCEEEEFFLLIPPMKMAGCSEMSAHKIHTLGNYPKERTQGNITYYHRLLLAFY